MGLSEELISQLAKTISDRGSNNNDYTVYGTISEDGDRYYVKLDGSDVSTPVETTVEVSNGDRVIVDVKNHTATVTGNTSSPSLGIKTKGLLESRIKQTEDRIDLEVLDGENSLSSRLTLLSDKIESEVLDNANEDSLVSKITQTARDIETYVGKDGEFTKFKQTVEGWEFVDENGSLKIEDGAIKWDHLTQDSKDQLGTIKTDAASAASSASAAAGSASAAESSAAGAITAATNIATGKQAIEDGGGNTFIDKGKIYSPIIYSGKLYATKTDDNTYAEMSSDGFRVYRSEITVPKIQLYTNTTGSEIYLRLGSGSNASGDKNYFEIKKTSTATTLTYVTENGAQATITFDSTGKITIPGLTTTTTVTAVWG